MTTTLGAQAGVAGRLLLLNWPAQHLVTEAAPAADTWLQHVLAYLRFADSPVRAADITETLAVDDPRHLADRNPSRQIPPPSEAPDGGLVISQTVAQL